MRLSLRSPVVYGAVLLAVGFAVGSLFQSRSTAHAQPAQRVFELRTYTAPDGKLEELHTRFRDHTLRIFEKHGMTNVGYWRPQDDPLKANTLIYILAHPSRDAAAQSWKAFSSDPEWQKVAADSQVDGRIVSRVESVFLDPTDYSPMK
jgi:hypothetical protein